jgi:hypothetical protein
VEMRSTPAITPYFAASPPKPYPGVDCPPKMSTTDYPVKLTGPDTYRLADMAGVHMDLRTVTGTCAQLQRKVQRESDAMLELEAMQAFALIRYGRCFKGGVRTAFLIPPEWIAALPAELRHAHADFLALRDKHIAHSVNDWELNIPVARVRVDQETGGVLGALH